jgi:DNA excision repair protein ERCC-2
MIAARSAWRGGRLAIDAEARTLRLGVTTLAHADAFDPGPGRRGRRGAALGTALHARYQRAQEARDPTFRAEVSLSATFQRSGWTVTLEGRADGIRGDPGQLQVVECKTTRPGRTPSPAAFPAYARQARAYAWMLEGTEGAPVTPFLVWLPTDGAPAREEPLPATAREANGIAIDLGAALDRCIAAAEEDAERRRVWRDAAASVAFPHATRREGQARIEAAVEAAVLGEEHLLIEAGTGMGKTAAALTPLLRIALAEDLRVLFLTASGTQQRLALATLRDLAPAGIATAARIVAKDRGCATGELLCHPVPCAFARNYTSRCREHQLPGRAFAGGIADARDLRAAGLVATACPVELAFDAGRAAAVTVADVNYAFDPAVALPEIQEPGALRRMVLAVDEVHRLPERARQARTVLLGVKEVQEAADIVALGSTALHRELRERILELAGCIDACALDLLGASRLPEQVWCEGAPPDDAWRALAAAFDDAVVATINALDGAPAEGPAQAFLRLAFQVEAIQAAAEDPCPRVTQVGAGPDGAALRSLCLDAAPALAPILHGARAFVGLSATLAPVATTRTQLGIDPVRFAHEPVPVSRGRERLRVVIEPAVTTTHRQRRRETPGIARRVRAFAEAVPGNVLVVASSFVWLEALAAALPAGRHAVLRQAATDGEAGREALLRALQEDSPSLLMAVAGGALAEGADTAGARLGGVAVIGPCLPAPDEERRLLATHREESGEDGFEAVYAVPGMRRVVQSAGRLQRRPEDRGVVALFGRRFLATPYVDLLPLAWRPEGAEALVGDPAAVARAFFEDDTRAGAAD